MLSTVQLGSTTVMYVASWCIFTVGMIITWLNLTSLSPGLGMEWVLEPPDEVEVGQVHNVSYRATSTPTLPAAFPDL